MNQIVSLKFAKEAGLTRYFTGKPCKHGHVEERTTCDRSCLGCIKEKRRRPENKKRHAEKMRERYKREDVREYYKNIYYQKDKALILKREKEIYWNEGGREKVLKRRAIARKTKAGIASGFIRDSLRRVLVSGQSSKIGYKRSDLVSRIESTMADGMSWENYGEWHIDHIVPVCWFTRHGVRNPRIVNDLNNLRASWKADNLRRGGEDRWADVKVSARAVAEALRRTRK